MWRALFIGWLALALAEETAKKEDNAGLTKRQNPRGSTVIYGASPGQYSLQSGDRVSAHSQPQAQIPSDYQQQSELYVISPNRKPAASALTYSSESPRRPQYIQVSALQLQAAQQAAQAAQAAHSPQQHHLVQQQQQQQPSHHHHAQQQQQQQQIAYESLIGQTEAGHGSFYRPATVRYQQQPQPQAQPEARAQPDHQAVQYAASAIVDSHAGSFERELAQLVAANRAQEQKYNAGQGAKKLAAPQQYLKEITRPAPRPISAGRVAPAPVQYQHQQPIPVSQQSAPLYRLIYQADQLQQLPQVNAQSQYKPQQASHEPAQYARPQLQQYIHAQPHAQPQLQLQQVRLRPEDDGSQLLRAHPSSPSVPQHRPSNDASTSSRSTIYVSQSTPLKKPAYTALAALAATEREEEEPKHQVPQLRLPQRNRPLTQDEFQQLIQSGAYTATLVPSDNPNSPHHEYLLHPTQGQGQGQGHSGQQRPVYTSEKQQEAQAQAQAVTYLLPQSQHQRQVKRRPVYNIQQA